MISKIEILDISSVIRANMCKYLWRIRLDSYFSIRMLAFVGFLFHFVDDSDLGQFIWQYYLNTVFENVSMYIRLKV